MPAVNTYKTFEHISSDAIPSLKLELHTFKHKNTGAMHYHFAANNPENVFLVGFRTVPTDSTGVAHILEHTALCGSENYPVRDPFFMMLRRSLNTFMNALTSSDWTAYPFASCNKKDFDNLLSVYLDASFFSRLDPLDFAQEGHRVEFEDKDDSTTPLVYKGVVFNEMKGAMSSVSSVLWHTLSEHLFTETTYHHNSGGEPADIPDLSYEQLTAFYKKHYHPSNSVLMTFGDIPAAELQEKFEDRALNKFTASEHTIDIAPEPRLTKPKHISAPYVADDDSKSHVITGWLLGESSDINAYLEAHLLNGLLMDNSASPLRKVLETSQFGSSPSPLCGLDDSSKEMIFVAGLEGCDKQDTLKIEQEILAVLQNISDNGVASSEVDSVLHQLELHQREIGGDNYPFGLQLIMQSLPAVIHRGEPINVLNIDIALAQLRKKLESPRYVKDLARNLLLNNQHRVCLTLYPDTDLADTEKQAEQDALAAKKAQLTDTDTAAVISLANALQERQLQEDNPELLPKVGLEDIPADIPTHASTASNTGIKQTRYSAGTNGIVYQQLLISLAELTSEQRQLLPLYCQVLTELGIGENSYLTVQQRQAATVGNISSHFSFGANRQHMGVYNGFLTISSKALHRNYAAQTQLMVDTLTQVNFNEHNRIKELIQQYSAQKLQSIVQNGHAFAMQAASASFNPLNYYEYSTTGLKGIQCLKDLNSSLDDNAALSQLASDLNTLHQMLLASPRQVLEVADNDFLSAQNSIEQWPDSTDNSNGTFALPASELSDSVFWQTNTQVNFCGMALQTVAPTHADAGPLTVLGGFMRNGFLHTAVREQGGAYGGGASHDSGNGVFRFYSYRDPRLADTFTDFTRSIDWVLDTAHEQRALEEAILGVVGGMDKPGSPAGEAKGDFYHNLFGRSHTLRTQFRQAVVNTSLDDLKRVTQAYLTKTPRYALVSNEANIQNAQAQIDEYNAIIELL